MFLTAGTGLTKQSAKLAAADKMLEQLKNGGLLSDTLQVNLLKLLYFFIC